MTETIFQFYWQFSKWWFVVYSKDKRNYSLRIAAKWIWPVNKTFHSKSFEHLQYSGFGYYGTSGAVENLSENEA